MVWVLDRVGIMVRFDQPWVLAHDAAEHFRGPMRIGTLIRGSHGTKAMQRSVATNSATAKATKIRPLKTRWLKKMASPQSLAPTVRLASGNAGRMRVAV